MVATFVEVLEGRPNMRQNSVGKKKKKNPA